MNTYIIDDIQMKKKCFIDKNNKCIELQLTNCKIIEISDCSIKVKSKSLERLYPLLITLEKKHNLHTGFTVEEHGVCFNVNMHTDTSSFKDILHNDGVYNIELRLHSIRDSCLNFKILRIIDGTIEDSDVEFVDDVAEPDNLDIEEIRLNITHKIKKLKKKYLEISKHQIYAMSLADLISLEDNLYEFFQNNI